MVLNDNYNTVLSFEYALQRLKGFSSTTWRFKIASPYCIWMPVAIEIASLIKRKR
jgi:hypothetical protein